MTYTGSDGWVTGIWTLLGASNVGARDRVLVGALAAPFPFDLLFSAVAALDAFPLGLELDATPGSPAG